MLDEKRRKRSAGHPGYLNFFPRVCFANSKFFLLDAASPGNQLEILQDSCFRVNSTHSLTCLPWLIRVTNWIRVPRFTKIQNPANSVGWPAIVESIEICFKECVCFKYSSWMEIGNNERIFSWDSLEPREEWMNEIRRGHLREEGHTNSRVHSWRFMVFLAS